MTDIVDPPTRSRMMRGIRSGNTKPEILIRKSLHRAGFRFCLQGSDLPGKPDIILPKYHAVIFVNGCFWHAHKCALFRWPATNAEFWKEKIEGNAVRDKKNMESLIKEGWRVAIIWECAIRLGKDFGSQEEISKLIVWLKGKEPLIEIPLKKGTPKNP